MIFKLNHRSVVAQQDDTEWENDHACESTEQKSLRGPDMNHSFDHLDFDDRLLKNLEGRLCSPLSAHRWTKHASMVNLHLLETMQRACLV